MTDQQLQELFRKADEAIAAQWRNVNHASIKPDRHAEQWAYSILRAQLVALLGPYGYVPKDE